jgi:hypothetical protein
MGRFCAAPLGPPSLVPPELRFQDKRGESVNDKVVVEYTEPDNVLHERGRDSGRVLSSGTFAIAGT